MHWTYLLQIGSRSNSGPVCLRSANAVFPGFKCLAHACMGQGLRIVECML